MPTFKDCQNHRDEQGRVYIIVIQLIESALFLDCQEARKLAEAETWRKKFEEADMRDCRRRERARMDEVEKYLNITYIFYITYKSELPDLSVVWVCGFPWLLDQIFLITHHSPLNTQHRQAT